MVLTTLWDNDGQIKGFSSITQNITVQRQAEEALRKSEETNRALLEAIPDFLIWMNREGNYLDVRNLDKLQLLSKDTVFTGKNVNDILPPDLANLRYSGSSGFEV